MDTVVKPRYDILRAGIHFLKFL
ncbi:MAG TPA: hypothetical protein LFW20_01780 [Rickettsia endosymbiont of Omalisus fontisbellaquei]|nr:hypothetical protein [Rickettsia endosymbiont of Omalisus fontisbellaquei]